jgi:hypothetical protein
MVGMVPVLLRRLEVRLVARLRGGCFRSVMDAGIGCCGAFLD